MYYTIAPRYVGSAPLLTPRIVSCCRFALIVIMCRIYNLLVHGRASHLLFNGDSDFPGEFIIAIIKLIHSLHLRLGAGSK